MARIKAEIYAHAQENRLLLHCTESLRRDYIDVIC